MTATEVKQSLMLISRLWTNYRLPTTEADLESLVAAWLPFFGAVPQAEVNRVIMEIAAEGTEFAPQVGQIYARLKQKRLPQKKDDTLYTNLCVYAAVLEIPPPKAEWNNAMLIKWGCEMRDKYGKRSN